RVRSAGDIGQCEVRRDEAAECLRALARRDADERRAGLGIERERAIERGGDLTEIEHAALAESRAGGQRHAHRVVAECSVVQLPAECLAQRVRREPHAAVFDARVDGTLAAAFDDGEHRPYPHAHTGCSKWSTRVGRPCITTSRTCYPTAAAGA